MKLLYCILILITTLEVLPTPRLKQGIKGKVFWIDNNQIVNPNPNSDPQSGVKREVFIYEATYLKDVRQEDGFFTAVGSKLISSFFTRDDGSFKVKLPPGNYSLFVKEPKGLYANLFDRQNQINPVTVKPKQYAWMTILIDYQAAN